MAALAAHSIREKRRRQADSAQQRTAAAAVFGAAGAAAAAASNDDTVSVAPSGRSSADWQNYREGLLREQEVRGLFSLCFLAASP